MSVKTRVGNVVEVINQNKKKGSNDTYHSVLLKDTDGHIHEYLFTQVELNVAFSRARKNIEDTLEQSFISKVID